MLSIHFITNFPQNAAVKKLCKSVNIWQRYGQNFVAYFLGHPQHPVYDTIRYDMIVEFKVDSKAEYSA